MAGKLQKRSVRIKDPNGVPKRTSVALEQPFWVVIEQAAKCYGQTLPVYLAQLDAERAKQTPDASLASAARVAALKFIASGAIPSTLRQHVNENMA